MYSVALALGLLLGAGVLFGRLAQAIRLPSVTGYIVAGLLIGPFGLHMITEQTASHDLDHFTQLALMLIAFGIGEHLELKPLKRRARQVAWVSLGESTGAFLLVSVGCAATAWLVGAGAGGWGMGQYALMGLLLGAVAVATAPASTLHVTRELKSSGPLTSTLLPTVAMDNAIAILLFGIIFTVATELVGGAQGPVVWMVARSVGQTGLALLLGLAGGLVLDLIIMRLQSRSEMLCVGLAVLLLCGETARLFNLQPLLVGIAVGFIVVNHGRRDVRIFRAINDFEPPIYILFFTLAGAHVDVSALGVAGGLAVLYFCLRGVGKMGGATLGALIARAPSAVRRLLGLALLPQAGVAIGLVFLIEGEPAMDAYNDIITPTVLAAVMLAELLGPVSTRLALTKAGEAGRKPNGDEPNGALREPVQPSPSGVEGLKIFPWRWERLSPAETSSGVVVFGLDHPDIAVGLARVSTILSHYYQANPVGLRVYMGRRAEDLGEERRMLDGLTAAAATEVESMGYQLSTELLHADDLIEGFVAGVEKLAPKAVVVGYEMDRRRSDSLRIAEALAAQNVCPVLVVRFGKELNTRRILVPVVTPGELKAVGDTVAAMSRVGMHTITLLRILPGGDSEEQLARAEQELNDWVLGSQLGQHVTSTAVAAESRVQAILEQGAAHDLVIMAGHRAGTMQRIFFGSLAQDVLVRCTTTVILVHRPRAKKDRSEDSSKS